MGIDLLSERARRVAAIAQRLRVVQAELADHPAEERRAHMRDEIELVLRSMVPGERKQFLFELMDTFPILGEGGGGGSGQAAPEPGAKDMATIAALSAAQAELAAVKTELSKFTDPAHVTERLIELAKRLPQEQRATVIKKLGLAGLAEVRTVEVAKAESAPAAPVLTKSNPPTPVPTEAPASASLAADLRKTTGLAETDPVDSARIGELAAVLAEFGGGLDELVWTAWRQVIAPQSRISRPGPLKRTFGQFIRGDQAITRQRVLEDVKLLRLITAATIAATSRAGKNFARKHLVKFSPDAIKAATGSGGWGAQAKYWAKYEELAGVLTEETIEAEIMQTIGEAARGLAEGKDGAR